MGKKQKTPKAPDPNKVIPLQTKANQDAFQYQLDQQRVNSTGFGGDTATWTQTPGVDGGAPTWGFKQSLSPEQQALYDRAQGDLSQPADFSQIQQVNGGDRVGAEEFARGLAQRSLGDNFNNTVADATYGQQTRYLDPQIQQQNQALEARLAEQGFVPGTPGYQQAMMNFMDTRNRAYGQARDSAITAGYGQGNTQLGLQGQIAQLLNQTNTAGTGRETVAQQAQISRMLQERGQGLDDFSSLRSALNPAQFAFNTPGMAAADVQGAYQNQYQGQLARANAKNSAFNSLLGTGVGLGAAYLTGGGSLFGGLGGALAGGGAGADLVNSWSPAALRPAPTGW